MTWGVHLPLIIGVQLCRRPSTGLKFPIISLMTTGERALVFWYVRVGVGSWALGHLHRNSPHAARHRTHILTNGCINLARNTTSGTSCLCFNKRSLIGARPPQTDFLTRRQWHPQSVCPFHPPLQNGHTTQHTIHISSYNIRWTLWHSNFSANA